MAATLKAAQEDVKSLATKMLAVVQGGETQAEKKSKLDVYEVDLKAAQAEVALHESVKGLTAGSFESDGTVDHKSGPAGDVRAKSLGEQVTESAHFKSMPKSGQFTTGDIEVKVAATIDEGGLAAGLPTPTYLPGIVDLRFMPLVVSDLFPQGTLSGTTLSYAKESAFTDGTAPTAEKGKSGQSDDAFVRLTESLGKITTIAKLTSEILEDVPAVQSFLNARLVNAVSRKEQDGLLNGTGLPGIVGLLGRAGLATTVVQAVSPDNGPDALFRQITAVRVSAWIEPDGIIMHPTDWQKLRLAKDAQGQYYAGGPFTGAYGTGTIGNPYSIWGLKVVVTPAIAQGTALVGSFSQGGQVFRRGGISVTMTNSNVDDFENGLVTVRAEERALLAVYRPGAFGKVTLL